MLNEQDQSLEFRNGIGEISDKHMISIAESYERGGKAPKILREDRYPLRSISFSPDPIVYDRYFAIDTSYVQVGKYLMCATSCLSVEQHLNKSGQLNKGDQLDILQVPRLIFLAKPGSKPERYGWAKVIEATLRYEKYNKEWKYGIVVDSDLDELPKINSGEDTVNDNLYLPDNMSLIYASADVGKEHFLNKLIKATDMVASKTLMSAIGMYGNHDHINFHGYYHDIAVMNDVIKISL